MLLVTACAAQAQVRFHTGSLDAVRALAERENKLVFIDLYATWCAPCGEMEREVFARRDVGEFMDARFVAARYDVDGAVGGALSQRYDAKTIPTYLIFNVEGQLLGRTSGGRTAAEFLRDMRILLDRLRERGDLPAGSRSASGSAHPSL